MPEKVKLVMGEIYSDENLRKQAESDLIQKYGGIEFESETIPFSFTKYYEKEMGEGLLRRWISFKRRIPPEQIPAVKLSTNGIEEKFSDNGSRRINLDPGYVSGASLILASTKNYSHRVYLGSGIYAEVTLVFENGNWMFLKWTYPDYKTREAFEFLSKVRQECLR